ncbi:alanine racemase C-terminal domain-containing protein [Microbacterium betulae]|uniref:Alanine racemase C-terminal domain-containing protein n=1 Tax=Microbacterium betulae TaxID=2981139 RepID=A0AA97I674_9MICO|nr:alanine racemase C-terminal domain-containing protein [Microbacterium sp. AB]WOF24511.1 alanine racemase C-terminal domain-containing protein [Microbacterium sp. AB]
MTSPSTRTSAPRARVSLSALAANILLARRRAGSDAVADLRRDAWGHGILTVGRALAESGVRAARADAVDAAIVEELGLVLSETEPTLPAALVFGLPGGGGAPVLSLVSRVLSTKPLLAGEGVSYGYLYRAPADTRVALVPGGYAQGVVRALGSRAHVDIGGARRAIVGRVAMDVCVVDVGPQEDAAPGDEAVFFGSGAVRDEIAEWSRITGLDAAELVARVGLGVAREVAE